MGCGRPGGSVGQARSPYTVPRASELTGRNPSQPEAHGGEEEQPHGDARKKAGRPLAPGADEGKGRDQVYVIQADGSDLKRVTDGSGNNVFPAWSPDGRKVVFASNRDGKDGLFSVGVDGSNIVRLLDRGFFARWSPDGRWLGFIDGDWPGSHIFTIRPDGSGLRRLRP